MHTTPQPAITYENPPLNEVICGIHFNEITTLRAGHLGFLWQRLGPNFTSTEDHPVWFNPTSEEAVTDYSIPPLLPRVWFVHTDETELIQMQLNRFVYNWRKRGNDDKYPGYPIVMGNFEKYLSCFKDFLSDQQLGDFTPRRYELAYVNHILENEGWETLRDFEKVLPNFIAYKGQNTFPPNISEIHWKMGFRLPDDSGQLQLLIRNARRIADDRPLLRIQFRAIRNQPHPEMRKWFDSAHDVIRDIFSNLASHEIQEKYWGRK